jgi:hypothetical protein
MLMITQLIAFGEDIIVIKNGRTKKKPLYEPPKVMRLDGEDQALGATCGPGSGAKPYCDPNGNSATGCYDFGNSPTRMCKAGNGD